MTQRATTLPEAAPSNPNRGDAIDSWLGMFTKFLRLPSEQSRAIRDELDSHIRERVRDLMLAGLNEDEGVRRAIDELGEAAELAAHFRAAHRPNRRMLMSIAAIGVAAGAAVISVVALTQAQPAAKAPEAAAVQAGSDKTMNGVPVLRDIPIVGTMFVAKGGGAGAGGGMQAGSTLQAADTHLNLSLSNTTLRKASEAIASALGKRVSLQTGAASPDVQIESLELVDVDLAAAVRQINGIMGLKGEDRLDFRVRGDVIDVAMIRDFDKAETTLVAYDLSDAIRCDAKTDELVETLTQFVEPEGWRDNGGDTARLKVVGNRMFVEAPPRYHERVAWILAQFSARRETVSPALFGGRAEALRTDLNLQREAFLRREIAWTKVMLGETPAAEEAAWMDDQRAVHAIEDPAGREVVRKQLQALVEELDTLRTASAAAAPSIGSSAGRKGEAAAQIKASGPYSK